jgi:hypothetical protein
LSKTENLKNKKMKRLTIASYFVLLFAVACNSEKKDTTSDSAKVDTAAVATAQVDTAAMIKHGQHT